MASVKSVESESQSQADCEDKSFKGTNIDLQGLVDCHESDREAPVNARQKLEAYKEGLR